jgi:hypothetical protein
MAVSLGLLVSNRYIGDLRMAKKMVLGCLAALGGLVIVCSVINVFLAMINSRPSQRSTDNTGLTPQQEMPQATVEDPIQIDVQHFLSAYRTDGEAANRKYKGKKVELTGVVTGVFVPSFVTSMRLEQTGGHADAFVTMGGPIPRSPEETLFLPGVVAYSESQALFGQSQFTPALLSLRRGITATILCTDEQGRLASDMGAVEYASSLDYSVQLDDCVLKSVRSMMPQDQGSDEAKKVYQLMDKNYAEHPYNEPPPAPKEPQPSDANAALRPNSEAPAPIVRPTTNPQ